MTVLIDGLEKKTGNNYINPALTFLKHCYIGVQFSKLTYYVEF